MNSFYQGVLSIQSICCKITAASLNLNWTSVQSIVGRYYPVLYNMTDLFETVLMQIFKLKPGKEKTIKAKFS